MATDMGAVSAVPARRVAARENPASFEEFYEGASPRLFAALRLVARNRYEAEEVAQEAFLRVFERWEKVSTLDDPTGYVFQVAFNVFRSRTRRAALGIRRALFMAPAEEDDLAAFEARHEVFRLLRGLNPIQRAAVLLTAILDFSNEEAGEILGLRASSVRSLTTRARARMKLEVSHDG
jgi:RNA polymerase sigma-70 factor (ECF subfamily)